MANPADYGDPRLVKFAGANESLLEQQRSLLTALAEGGSAAVQKGLDAAPALAPESEFSQSGWDGRFAQQAAEANQTRTDANSQWFDRMQGVVNTSRQDADNERLRMQQDADFALREREAAFSEDFRLRQLAAAGSGSSSRSGGGGGGGGGGATPTDYGAGLIGGDPAGAQTVDLSVYTDEQLMDSARQAAAAGDWNNAAKLNAAIRDETTRLRGQDGINTATNPDIQRQTGVPSNVPPSYYSRIGAPPPAPTPSGVVLTDDYSNIPGQPQTEDDVSGTVVQAVLAEMPGASVMDLAREIVRRGGATNLNDAAITLQALRHYR